ncbi:MAG: hypothetical protein LR001_00130 [Clostridiales bacterium]|nr:hypothetical protein [Clostridiales bacterium]
MITIKNVIKNTSHDKENFGVFFAMFLDSFYRATSDQKQLMVIDEPEEYENISSGKYAYISGVVEKLCRDSDIVFPNWVFKEKYFLKEPYFSLDSKGMLKLILLLESPIEFRMRNVFVNNNTLTRV